MNKWTKHVIEVKGFPVKVYINTDNTQSYVFPLFGKYYGLSSDVNVLDFTTDFLIGTTTNVVTFSNYLNSLEDTAVIDIETVKAA